MLRFILFLAAYLWALPALADCREEALAARASVSNSGPLHFERTVQSQSNTSRLCGQIDPYRAQHDRSCEAKTDLVNESIWIEKKSWNNDGLGWQGPYGATWTHGHAMPAELLPLQFVRISCVGRINEGRELEKYQFVIDDII